MFWGAKVHISVLKRTDLSNCVHKHTFERVESTFEVFGCISAYLEVF